MMNLLAAAVVLSARLTAADIRIVFAGDIMLDNGPGHTIFHGGDPFAKVAAAIGDADLTIGNLECAITRKGDFLYKPYTFRGPVESLPLLKKYFSAVSLANNHSGDWGKEGFADMLTLLGERGVRFFGGGRNRREAHTPLVLEAQGKRVAFLGYNDFPPRSFAAGRSKPGIAWLEEPRVIADIAAARRSADFVILFFHWGTEMEPEPDAGQRAMARRFIDAGASAVIGGHPHVTQGVDWCKGRPVVYSLGNLVFDYYPQDPAPWRGWIARVTLGEGETKLEVRDVEMDAAGSPYLTSDWRKP